MKRKGFRAISLILVFSLLLSVFMLTACTDKEKPRELDSVEQSIVGTWTRRDDIKFTFYSDGTWIAPGYTSKAREFRHTDDGWDGDRMTHYHVIDCNADTWVLFDDEPNVLYLMINSEIYNKNTLVRE